MSTPGGRSLGKQLNLYGNPCVLMISPTLILVSTIVLMVSPSVPNPPCCPHDIPHTHHGIPPVY